MNIYHKNMNIYYKTNCSVGGSVRISFWNPSSNYIADLVDASVWESVLDNVDLVISDSVENSVEDHLKTYFKNY